MPFARQVQVTIPKAEQDSILEAIRQHEFTDMITVVDANYHIIISFKCTTKRLQSILHMLRHYNVGVDFGCIDVYELQSSIPFMTRVKSKKKRQYRIDDRKTVEEIYHQLENQIHLTFDYIVLVICAAILAGVGILQDSDAVVVASMIVSPLMSAIQGITFGAIIQDKTMLYKSFRNETLGAFLAFLVGVIIAACLLPWFGYLNIPTKEMTDRGSSSVLVAGAFIAIPSGAAVALAIAGGCSSTLVGVAISAALLPPLVNSGINVVFATHCYLHNIVVNNEDPLVEDYTTKVGFRIALWSFVLFLSNFVIIFVVGIVFYRLKSVHSFRNINYISNPLSRYRFDDYPTNESFFDGSSTPVLRRGESVNDSTPLFLKKDFSQQDESEVYYGSTTKEEESSEVYYGSTSREEEKEIELPS